MNMECKKFEELTVYELYEILKVRSNVFIVEQNCVYDDVDEKDLEAVHITLKDNKKILAYIRVLKPGVSFPNASIGRVLVTKNSRGKNLGRVIFQAGIDYIFNEMKEKSITIGAQNYLKAFYESFGFKAVSEVYLEDGIEHLDMTLNLTLDK